MLRVTVELVPFGIESHAQALTTVYIGNDGTGDPEHGNYDVYLNVDPRGRPYAKHRSERPGHIGRIENFPRHGNNHRRDNLAECALRLLNTSQDREELDDGTVLLPS